MTTIDSILLDFDRAERLRDWPGRYFPAKLAAEKKLKQWAETHPEELAKAAADGTIPGYLLETIGREDLIPEAKDPAWKSDPNSHYNRARRHAD